MSDKKEELEERGRNVVTRTNAQVKKDAARKKREKLNPDHNRTQILIEAQGDNITSREIFGKKMIPISGVFKNVTVKIPEVLMPVTLHVLSEYEKHERRDSFELSSGITQLQEPVDIKAGTVLKFSLEFEGEELSEVYLSGILITK